VKPEQWETFKAAAKGEYLDRVPLAMVVDSPWIPGFLGMSHLDFYLDMEAWYQANISIIERFPQVIFFPSWWVEYGMAVEASALGARVRFWPDQMPSQEPMLFHKEDLDKLRSVDCQTDGLMPLVLRRYERCVPRIVESGYTVPVVAARGPLCIASHLRGVTELMMDLMDDPHWTRTLLDQTTHTVIQWLKAQAEAVGDTVEGIFVLDDIVGFLSKEQYLQFAHPYLKRICDAFPKDWVKVYHNDANVDPFLEDLARLDFDVLNWGKQLDAASVKERTGQGLVLMGNVDPLDVATRGTPQQVEKACMEVLEASEGEGLILSVGGGTCPGMPGENLLAMVRALEKYHG